MFVLYTGYETTASLLQFTIILIFQHPEVLTRLVRVYFFKLPPRMLCTLVSLVATYNIAIFGSALLLPHHYS